MSNDKERFPTVRDLAEQGGRSSKIFYKLERPYERYRSQSKYDFIELTFSEPDLLMRHLSTIMEFINNGTQDTTTGYGAIADAFNYLGLDLYQKDYDLIYGGGVKLMATARRLTFDNPATNPDFFDLLRTLDNTIMSLSAEIRAVNDPDRMTAEIKAARAYLDAFRSFLDIERGQSPPEFPAEIHDGVLNKIRKIDWLRISENAQKWADTISNIISKLFH